jgi:hypothetical protein
MAETNSRVLADCIEMAHVIIALLSQYSELNPIIQQKKRRVSTTTRRSKRNKGTEEIDTTEQPMEIPEEGQPQEKQQATENTTVEPEHGPKRGKSLSLIF